MPIIGVIDSAKTGRISTNSYDAIGTYQGTGSSGNIVFSSIPSTYQHLELRILSQTNRVGGPTGSGSIYFNSDTTGSNYYTHSLYSQASSPGGTFAANENYGVWWYGSTASSVPAIIRINNYANTNMKKVAQMLTGFDANGNGAVGWTTFMWNNTTTINSITISPAGQNFLSTARFSLYGIKGS